jgi:hypothetical protein
MPGYTLASGVLSRCYGNELIGFQDSFSADGLAVSRRTRHWRRLKAYYSWKRSSTSPLSPRGRCGQSVTAYEHFN